jgi:hypothetical protein
VWRSFLKGGEKYSYPLILSLVEKARFIIDEF